MPKLKALVKYDLCNPEKCNSGKGVCIAVKACTHGILEQEEAFDSPICFSCEMCKGCGDCARGCPLDAIWMA